MDEVQVGNFLCASGGDPTGISCAGGATSGSFGDVSGAPGVVNPFLAGAGPTTNQLIRYIEVMSRRGYTKGCGTTADPIGRFCPNDPVTRAQMAVFLIRAKMNNVFPTTLSGIPLSSPYGDNFGLFAPPTPYFTDLAGFSDFAVFINKMRELRITNGTGGTTYTPAGILTRDQIATFIVRAFFL